MLTDLESLAPQPRKRDVAMRDHPGGELSREAIEESFDGVTSARRTAA